MISVTPDELDDASLRQASQVHWPLSPAFIEFLAKMQDGILDEKQEWPDQVSEKLIDGSQTRVAAQSRLSRLLTYPPAVALITEVDSLASAIAAKLRDDKPLSLGKFQFVLVVGVPRSGGSYLTAEFLRALGNDPFRTPSSLAHDGFPDLRLSSSMPCEDFFNSNTWHLAEYFAMVNIFFNKPSNSTVLVPKKLTKAVYAQKTLSMILPSCTIFFVTVRDPITTYLSSIEKSGGATPDGKIQNRSTIEKWIMRDLVVLSGNDNIKNLSYFDAYLLYWESYYIRIAEGKLITNKNSTIVLFGKASMEQQAKKFFEYVGVSVRPTEFFERKYSIDIAHLVNAATSAIQRVARAWERADLDFPVEAMLRALSF